MIWFFPNKNNIFSRATQINKVEIEMKNIKNENIFFFIEWFNNFSLFYIKSDNEIMVLNRVYQLPISNKLNHILPSNLLNTIINLLNIWRFNENDFATSYRRTEIREALEQNQLFVIGLLQP